MSKNQVEAKSHPKPLVTEKTRRPRPGFTNPHKGIEVAPGLNLQDVPRDMLQQHLRANEELHKQRFKDKYSGSHGGSQSF